MAQESVPDLAESQQREFMVGSEWLEWRNHPKTQLLVKILRDTAGSQQDAWLNMRFVNDEKQGLIALGESNFCLFLADRIENIKIEEKKEQ